MKVYLTQDTSAGGKFWEIKVGEKSFTIRYGKLGCSGRTMSPKKFASRKKCETNAKALIRKKKDAGYCEQKTKGRKRKQLDYSSDEDASDSSEQPPAKKRKTNTRKSRKKKKKAPTPTPSSDSSSEQDDEDEYDSNDRKNEKVLRPMLEVSSVLLQDKDEKQKYEVVINENKTYSIVEGKIGTKGRKLVKRADSKQDAFDEALHLLVLKMRNKWSIVESSEDEEEASSSEEEEEGIFSDVVFVLSGGFSKSQSAIKKLIRDNDGTVKPATTAKIDVVLVKTVGANLESTKCATAIKLKIPIVGEDYLHDCIAKKEELKYDKYIIDESESESDDEDIKMSDKNKKKKTKSDDNNHDNDTDGKGPKESVTKTHKFRGSAPVDEFFSRGPEWSVYEEDGVVYDAMLNQTNIGNNNNKMYKIHVLKHDTTERYCTYFRWARVGYTGQHREVDGTKQQSIALFMKKFHDKTLNDWDDRDDFEFRAGKYMYLPMDYGADAEGDGDDAVFDGSEEHKCESKLDDGIQELVQLIFDKDMMDTQMKEIGYDAAKLPLGKVSKRIIAEAYKILQQIENEINKGNDKSNKNKNNDSDAEDDSGSDSDYATKKRKRKSRKSNRKVQSETLDDLSSEYYTLIPHEFAFKKPPSIDSEKRLNVEMKLIEALSEIEVAKRLLAGRDSGAENYKHPIDKNFDLLKCDMQSIDKKSEEFEMLSTYVRLTHAATHNRFKLSVERAYALDREGSGDRFEEFCGDKNRMLLWHGSRLTNFVGIISQGLRIAPPEAPVTGYMFGKGVYFADMCSKSANYCATSVQNNTGLILLCEVALGDMNELLHSDYYADQLPKGKKSTKGCGRTTPDPSTYVTLENGCVVPSGKGVVDERLQSSLLYNEYIVYDTAQIKMKYLLRLNFDYGDASF